MSCVHNIFLRLSLGHHQESVPAQLGVTDIVMKVGRSLLTVMCAWQALGMQQVLGCFRFRAPCKRQQTPAHRLPVSFCYMSTYASACSLGCACQAGQPIHAFSGIHEHHFLELAEYTV